MTLITYAISSRAGVLAAPCRDAPLPVFDELRALFADDATAYIDAHNAAYGCFAARIGRNAT
ncbi:DUF1203 domain-containing protein [Sphingopyxis granuli]|uniref:DUF1203 domain-containing protein n=1 Tax=Sphingopyxis granuli TaxID=267128 RepID=UPI00082E7FC2|nr:DUF1203 domain-containing protein [Sphingopyxis granuli]